MTPESENLLAAYWAWWSEYNRVIEPKDPTRRLDGTIKDFMKALREHKDAQNT